jgi:hypothetical protein
MKIGPLPGRTNSTVRSVVLVLLVLDIDIMVALKSSVKQLFRHHHHFKHFDRVFPVFRAFLAMSQQPHTALLRTAVVCTEPSTL